MITCRLPSRRRSTTLDVRVVVGLLIVPLLLASFGCGKRPRRGIAGPGEQPFDVVYIAHFDSANWPQAGTDTVPAPSYRRFPRVVVSKPPLAMQVGADSAHFQKDIREWLADSTHAPDKAELILSFRDSVDTPRFPTALIGSAIGSPDWLLQRHVADSVVSSMRGRRAARYVADSLFLAVRGVAVVDKAWLVQALLVEAPITRSMMRALVDSLGAIYVQPRYAGERPPQDNTTDGDDPFVARDQIDSDPYVPFAPQYGRVALLDAGVLDVSLLQGRVMTTYDCLGADCIEAAIPEPCGGHGTQAASLLTGKRALDTGEQGPRSRFDGVTEAELVIYRVYGEDCEVGLPLLDTWAAGRAIAHATAQSIPIIVAEIDGEISPSWGYDEDDWNHMAIKSDESFEDGSLVIAAAGNQGSDGYSSPEGGKIASPAVARRVIAAGGYHVVTTTRYKNGGTGPTQDHRTKPEVGGPTNTETAGATGYTTFGATSGALPYVGGGAVLLRNWLIQASGGDDSDLDPGQVAAQIILAGQRPATRRTDSAGSVFYEFEKLHGAGMAVLPTGGYCHFSKASIDATGTVLERPFVIHPNESARLEAALWWPEVPLSEYNVEPTESQHNDIDLQIVAPDGTVAAESRVGPGVFERATAKPATGTKLAAGTWKIRIIGNSVPFGPQTVYWTAAARYRP